MIVYINKSHTRKKFVHGKSKSIYVRYTLSGTLSVCKQKKKKEKMKHIAFI